ncbi:MAG: zinc-finger domain-containing protein [Acetobacteraceae bacterium]|nr:zinc-finger domain-containing protein [Acetobacteraceae bacterium]
MPLPSVMPNVQTPEVIRVTEGRVACNGGGGALGHPRVWLTFAPDHRVVCPYCSRVFIEQAGEGNSGHH